MSCCLLKSSTKKVNKENKAGERCGSGAAAPRPKAEGFRGPQNSSFMYRPLS